MSPKRKKKAGKVNPYKGGTSVVARIYFRRFIIIRISMATGVLPKKMAEAGTLDIIGEIESIVHDKLQVVSYKWLSRNFSVSSNDAKRMLQDFVQQKGSELEVVYMLSGWLKNSPPVYHIRLVSGVKLAEVKKDFEDCSLQVYSVQACIPKDPAALWNAEFVQAEELFNQPPTVDNCLRDNRFCGVLNSFVQRNVNGTTVGVTPLQSTNAGPTVPSKTSNPIGTPTVTQEQKSSPRISPSIVAPIIKSESNTSEVKAQTIKAHTAAEKVATLPANKKKVQNEKSSSGSGGSLASLWGRASVKPESKHPPPETNKVVSKPIDTAEAQICAHESVDNLSSDDDAPHVRHMRGSNGEGNRKRRVVFDSSDEEDDDGVNLASPDPPKKLASQESDKKVKSLVVERNNFNSESHKGDRTEIKQEKTSKRESTLPANEDTSATNKSKTTGISLSVKAQTPVASNQKDKAAEPPSTSPKRRKVLKTRIDERGREVTEVVWEGEEIESKDTDKKSTNTDTPNNRATGAAATPTATASTKKSPAVGSHGACNPAGKGGAKKTGKGGVGGKDGKQGNIMSFFKKV